MNGILSKEVSFDLAKLLKEKEFNNIECSGYYHICDGYTKGYAHCYSDVCTQKEDAILAPTISEVIDWIYEKYGIWINVTILKWNYVTDEIRFHYKITKLVKHAPSIKINSDGQFKESLQAYEKAIEHTLENLIKHERNIK